MLSLILKSLFYIYIISGVFTLIIEVFYHFEYGNTTKAFVTCFIPVKNTINAVLYLVGLFVSIFHSIYLWYKMKRG